MLERLEALVTKGLPWVPIIWSDGFYHIHSSSEGLDARLELIEEDSRNSYFRLHDLRRITGQNDNGRIYQKVEIPELSSFKKGIFGYHRELNAYKNTGIIKFN